MFSEHFDLKYAFTIIFLVPDSVPCCSSVILGQFQLLYNTYINSEPCS